MDNKYKPIANDTPLHGDCVVFQMDDQFIHVVPPNNDKDASSLN